MGSKKLNVVFFGNNTQILMEIVKHSNVKAVFTRPYSDEDENLRLIKDFCQKESLPLFQTNKKQLYDHILYIKSLNLDLIVVCGYKYILTPDIYLIPTFKSINIHPSYLPHYRGQHVINWALINDEKYIGVTIHYIDSGIDTGDIISQEKVPILFSDTALTLSAKLYELGAILIKNILINLSVNNKLPVQKQDDCRASYFKPRIPDDGIIDWNKNGLEIYNLIRALVRPWPGAFTYVNKSKIIIYEAHFEHCDISEESGTIVSIDNNIINVAVNQGVLFIKDYEFINECQDDNKLILKCGMKFNSNVI